MTDPKSPPEKPGEAARRAREAELAKALRANLRRRKSAAADKPPKADD